MGGYDVYCAICGGTFSSRVSVDSDDETGYTYSGEAIGDSDLEWLSTLRALGRNPAVSGERKSFITGRARYDDAGAVLAYRGEDPNVPTDGDREPYFFCAYFDITGDLEDEPVFPFHELCFQEILLRCFKKDVLDGDVLYALCEQLVNESNGLLLDYGEPTPPYEQYWECRKGEEILVTNPVDIPELSKCLDEIQDGSGGPSQAPPQKDPEYEDIFSVLPYELRHEIFSLLPLASVLALKAASPSMHATGLPENNWTTRLEAELPWLWELHEIDPFTSPELESQLSRKIAFLEQNSQYKASGLGFIPGLANRRRIWAVCEDIKELYQDLRTERSGQPLKESAPLSICRANLARNRDLVN